MATCSIHARLRCASTVRVVRVGRKLQMGSRQASFSARITRRTPFQSETVNLLMLLAHVGWFRLRRRLYAQLHLCCAEP
jgi:hypothetical protein